MSDEWLTVYRGYSDQELADEITWLRGQVRNPFGSQTEGNRSVSRSTAEMRDRLAAATTVGNERAQASQPRHLTADFSSVRVR